MIRCPQCQTSTTRSPGQPCPSCGSLLGLPQVSEESSTEYFEGVEYVFPTEDHSTPWLEHLWETSVRYWDGEVDEAALSDALFQVESGIRRLTAMTTELSLSLGERGERSTEQLKMLLKEGLRFYGEGLAQFPLAIEADSADQCEAALSLMQQGTNHLFLFIQMCQEPVEPSKDSAPEAS